MIQFSRFGKDTPYFIRHWVFLHVFWIHSIRLRIISFCGSFFLENNGSYSLSIVFVEWRKNQINFQHIVSVFFLFSIRTHRSAPALLIDRLLVCVYSRFEDDRPPYLGLHKGYRIDASNKKIECAFNWRAKKFVFQSRGREYRWPTW